MEDFSRRSRRIPKIRRQGGHFDGAEIEQMSKGQRKKKDATPFVQKRVPDCSKIPSTV